MNFTKNFTNQPATSLQAKQTATAFLQAAAFAAVLAVPEMAFAQGKTFEDQACGVLDSVRGLLNMASIAVVTIAIVFAGYQIAFAHKRIGDVAPIMIGGLLIGAAGQLARWIMPERQEDCEPATAMMPLDSFYEFASTAAQSVQHLV